MECATITSDSLEVTICAYGATVVSVKFKGSEITVNDGLDAVVAGNAEYYGCVVGRFAGRLTTPRGVVLHGGSGGWSRRVWRLDFDDRRVDCCLDDVDDDGFDGRATARVRYAVSGGRLTIDYLCESDAPTVVSMTNHTYWNLGAPLGAHSLRVSSARWVETDAALVATGRIVDVSKTPLDFTTLKELRDVLHLDIDHCFTADVVTADLVAPKLALHLETTQPGLQVYTANFLPGARRQTAICLETQHLPNSPNYADTVPPAGFHVAPGAAYEHRTIITLEEAWKGTLALLPPSGSARRGRTRRPCKCCRTWCWRRRKARARRSS